MNSVTAIYNAWCNIKRRCNYWHSRSHKHYTDKNIKLCVEWKDFEVFKADMIGSWFPGAVMDRKDNNIGYCKSNCRWVTQLESRRNTSRVKLTIEKANKIKELFATGFFTHQQLATRFNCGRPSITKILNGNQWK
jgi:hypothetical protein